MVRDTYSYLVGYTVALLPEETVQLREEDTPKSGDGNQITVASKHNDKRQTFSSKQLVQYTRFPGFSKSGKGALQKECTSIVDGHNGEGTDSGILDKREKPS